LKQLTLIEGDPCEFAEFSVQEEENYVEINIDDEDSTEVNLEALF